MRSLNFSYNWNKKLDCKAFTTIRLTGKYEIGDEIEVWLNVKKEKNQLSGRYEIRGKKPLLIHQINEFIARLDTGYSREECITVLKNMYKKSKVDWDTQIIYLYLVIKLKPEN